MFYISNNNVYDKINNYTVYLFLSSIIYYHLERNYKKIEERNYYISISYNILWNKLNISILDNIGRIL